MEVNRSIRSRTKGRIQSALLISSGHPDAFQSSRLGLDWTDSQSPIFTALGLVIHVFGPLRTDQGIPSIPKRCAVIKERGETVGGNKGNFDRIEVP